jgi:hypothetical protein
MSRVVKAHIRKVVHNPNASIVTVSMVGLGCTAAARGIIGFSARTRMARGSRKQEG